jgi:hypothetical protein
MAIPNISNPNCDLKYGNTGKESCIKTLEHAKGFVLVPKGTVFKSSETVDFETTLKALCIKTLPAERAFPVIGLDDFTDSSKEQTVETLGFGGTIPLEGTEKVIYTHNYHFGFEFNKRLRKFNNTNKYDLIYLLADGTYYGTKRTDSDGNDGIAGFPFDSFNVMPMKLANGKDSSTKFGVTIVFSDSSDFNDNGEYINSTYSKMLELKGMIDATHTATGGVLKISVQMYTVADKINLSELYSTELADLSLHIVKKAGVVKTVGTSANDLVSIAYNALTKSHDITLYAGSAGTDFTHEFVNPTLLAAGDVGGAPGNYYEDVTVATAIVTAT